MLNPKVMDLDQTHWVRSIFYQFFPPINIVRINIFFLENEKESSSKVLDFTC